jgi:hypothetical protein
MKSVGSLTIAAESVSSSAVMVAVLSAAAVRVLILVRLEGPDLLMDGSLIWERGTTIDRIAS